MSATISTAATQSNLPLKRTYTSVDQDKTGATPKNEIKSMTKVTEWLEVLERVNEVELNDEVGSDETGTIVFKINNVTYGIPLTGIGMLIDAEEVEAVNGESVLKEAVESEYGPINKCADNLDKLADFLVEGAQLCRAAGIDKTKRGDFEPGADDNENESDAESDEQSDGCDEDE